MEDLEDTYLARVLIVLAVKSVNAKILNHNRKLFITLIYFASFFLSIQAVLKKKVLA